ncbi:MAG: hypothetical protein U1D70_15805 [Methylobacter sp.]|nr:hypothetical protein [Methylobacter sp.]MDP2429775.1 hypothetical protein [Methylobacter sp.]MDP3055495.1 hypothetical protein [Methylobacter sp.]MDP3363369.1 hypothetical protein [Methylobacter sp.]MDZ4220469.1 hypothetical protein [Methylobacter sp.]
MTANKINQGHPYIPHLKEGALRTFLVKRLLRLKPPAQPTLNYADDDRFTIPIHYQKSAKKPRRYLGRFRS